MVGFLSLVALLQVDCASRNLSSQSIGGLYGKTPGYYRAGDIVGVLDPKNPGEYKDVIVVDSFITTEEKPNSPGSDMLQQRRFVVLDGNGQISTVDTNGKQVGTPGTVEEYVHNQKEQFAAYLRNAKSLQALNQKQLSEAGAKLSKLDKSVDQFNERYTTVEGLSRLTAELAIAIAVDELSKNALPDTSKGGGYKGMSAEESDALSSVIKPTLETIGDAAKKAVNGTEGERTQEAAVDAGIAGTSTFTFGPILDQMEKAGKFGVPGSEDAQKKVKAIHAVAKGLVKAAVAGGQADDGEGLRDAQLALLDELYGYILPVPGANVLYSDATKMGVMLTDYSVVTSQLRGVANNQRVAIDNNRRFAGARNALQNMRCYDALIRHHVAASTAAIGVTTISGEAVPALVTSTGWNGARGDSSRPTTQTSTVTKGTPTTSAGTKR